MTPPVPLAGVITLHASPHAVGNCATPANAVGAPDGVYTTDSGSGANWTSRWDMESPGEPLEGVQSVDIAVRSQPTGQSGVCRATVRIWENGTMTHDLGETSINGSQILNRTWTPINVDAAVQIELITTATSTGSGGSRTAVGVDAFTWTAAFKEFLGSPFKGWDGGAWRDGVLQRWDGGGWVGAMVRRWNGNQWVEVR